MDDPSRSSDFRNRLLSKLEVDPPSGTPDTIWDNMREAIFSTALESYGKRPRVREDWVEAYSDVLLPLLEEKREALIAHNRSPSQTTRDKLKETKSKVQRESRKCANEYWNKLCADIQHARE